MDPNLVCVHLIDVVMPGSGSQDLSLGSLRQLQKFPIPKRAYGVLQSHTRGGERSGMAQRGCLLMVKVILGIRRSKLTT